MLKPPKSMVFNPLDGTISAIDEEENDPELIEADKKTTKHSKNDDNNEDYSDEDYFDDAKFETDGDTEEHSKDGKTKKKQKMKRPKSRSPSRKGKWIGVENPSVTIARHRRMQSKRSRKFKRSRGIGFVDPTRCMAVTKANDLRSVIPSNTGEKKKKKRYNSKQMLREAEHYVQNGNVTSAIGLINQVRT